MPKFEMDDPVPGRAAVEAALEAVKVDEHTAKEVAVLAETAAWALRAIPPILDFSDLTMQNPINQVYFRAGLLACREYMARFVEQGGDKTTANSIRMNWWPVLGEDPGAPRLFDFDEIAEEHGVTEDGPYRVTAKKISPSVEALPRAYQFLLPAA